MSSESGMHYYAKISACSWLRKMTGKKFKGLNNIGFKCNNPGKAPMFGVYAEYPVCLDAKDKKVIVGYNKTWWDYCNETGFKVKSKHGIPTNYELKQANDRFIILHIFDIAVLDDNRLSYIFEIKHTHAIDNKKIRFVEKYGIPTYEIDATWVLGKPKGKIPWDLEYIACYSTTTTTPNNVSESGKVV